LRDNEKNQKRGKSVTNAKPTGGQEDDKSQKGETGGKAADTVPNPPSFFEKDMEKWKAKFSKSIKER